MKIFISSIGSRGDVQPVLALAVELKSMHHKIALCTAPNFREWVESQGIEFIPIGPDLKKYAGGKGPDHYVKPSRQQLKRAAAQAVRSQFQVILEAARGYDLMIAGGAVQFATRSVAEILNVPYLFVAYSPVVLPSQEYPPPKIRSSYPQSLPQMINRWLWMKDSQSWNNKFRATLNEERVKFGLTPVRDVRSHIFTDHPWLASDPVLGPAPTGNNMKITQTGPWLLPDYSLLPDELEKFLASGDPPVYIGFGSTTPSDQTALLFIEAAKKLRLHVIISRGWADLNPAEENSGFLSIGDVNFGKLFKRVRAIIHHGGSGTTTAAALGGKPQVVVPHTYDQFYWANRVERSGIGYSVRPGKHLTPDYIAGLILKCLRPAITERAQEIMERIELQGARKAAERISKDYNTTATF